MNFETALTMMKKGLRITNPKYTDKGSYLFIEDGMLKLFMADTKKELNNFLISSKEISSSQWEIFDERSLEDLLYENNLLKNKLKNMERQNNE